ncbi:MAG: restriction endonuclease [Thermoplasmata archaeon]
MPEVYCVRAEFGRYADSFVRNGYVAIGWNELGDLSGVTSREQIHDLYIKAYPEDVSKYKIGQQVGQIYRFLLDMQAGDYVITPDADTEYIHWGTLDDKPYYFETKDDDVPYRHRRRVKWHREPVRRASFSVPFQNSIRSSLTVFWTPQKNSFFEVIGRRDLIDVSKKVHVSADRLVLDRILGLSSEEFEIFVTALLSTLGFESRHTGRSGDEGVDAEGELDLYGMAKIKLFVQAKRYKQDTRIGPKDVKKLRQNIPTGAQGAFVVTCDFTDEALKVATEPGFPRIGTVNGSQLVDILSEKWDELSDELPDGLREKLGLKRSIIAT